MKMLKYLIYAAVAAIGFMLGKASPFIFVCAWCLLALLIVDICYSDFRPQKPGPMLIGGVLFVAANSAGWLFAFFFV